MLIDEITNTSKIVVAGHRGYKAKYPENTLLAFREALDAGVHMLELDLRMSQDGQIVVIHDATVDRTTDGSGRVEDMTWAQLVSLDAGSWMGVVYAGLSIPLFEQFCSFITDYPQVSLNIEIKPSPTAKETADAAIAILRSYELEARCVFTSFDADVVAHLYDAYGAKVQGFLGKHMYQFVEGDEGTYSKMWAIAMEMSHLNEADVQRFRQLGKQVWSYCPDTTEQVQASLAAGVTVMTCNDPFPALLLKQQTEQNG